MKLTIDIPREYERDFIADKFKDFFSRVIADINCDGMCGFYEKEIAEMFLEAFDNAIVGDANLNANAIPVANISFDKEDMQKMIQDKLMKSDFHQEKREYRDEELIDMLVANYAEKVDNDIYFNQENYKEFLEAVYWFWKCTTNNFNKRSIAEAINKMLNLEFKGDLL